MKWNFRSYSTILDGNIEWCICRYCYQIVSILCRKSKCILHSVLHFALSFKCLSIKIKSPYTQLKIFLKRRKQYNMVNLIQFLTLLTQCLYLSHDTTVHSVCTCYRILLYTLSVLVMEYYCSTVSVLVT